MTARRTALALTVTTFLVFAASPEAFAKKGRRGRARERAPLVVDAGSPVQAGQARIELRRKSRSRQQLQVKLQRATAGAELVLFIEDDSGTLVEVGDFRGRRGRYLYRSRTGRGSALPLGVADLSELGGRDLEIRTTGGETVATASVPVIAALPSPAAPAAKVRNGLTVDDEAIIAAVEGGDDSPPSDSESSDMSLERVSAEIRLQRKRDRNELKVELDHAPGGLSVEAWVVDGDGQEELVGSLREEVERNGSEYELKARFVEGDVLPLGLAAFGDLAGLTIELRTPEGDVLASGTIPDVGGGSESGRDDDDGDDDGDDDADDDDADEDDGDDDDGGDDDGDDADEDDADDDDADDDDDEDDEDDDDDDDDTGGGDDTTGNV